jgi:hypothetical protein
MKTDTFQKFLGLDGHCMVALFMLFAGVIVASPFTHNDSQSCEESFEKFLPSSSVLNHAFWTKK